MSSKIKILLIVLVLFLTSLAVYYYPVYKKGYSFGFNAGNLISARNLAQTGQVKVENEKNVVLSSDRVIQEGIEYNPGNDLTYIIYGKLFKLFGFHQNWGLYLSIILWSISTILLFFLVKKLFNLKIATIFALLCIFLPVILQGVLTAGFYEWAILFFSLGLLTFFNTNKKTTCLGLVFSGIFFALAILSRNAFMFSVIPLVIYQFYRNRSIKKLLCVLIPLVVISGIFFGSNLLKGQGNDYLSGENLNFTNYSHLYPDPYTFHYEKEQYLQEVQGTSNSMFSQFLLKYKQKVSLKNQIIMYFDSAKFYPKEFLKLIVSGGPLIVLLMFFGLFSLFKKNRQLFTLFVIWFAVWYIGLVVMKTNNWDHFLELSWPIALLVSLGIYYLFKTLSTSGFKNSTKIGILVLASLCLILHFVQANKWMLYEEYKTSDMDFFLQISTLVQDENLDSSQVVAVTHHQGAPLALNYLINKNFVYFHVNTLKKLLANGNLQSVFNDFGVTHVAGFGDELEKEIQKDIQVKIIK